MNSWPRRSSPLLLWLLLMLSGCSWADHTSVALLDQSRREPPASWYSHLNTSARSTAGQRDVEVFLEGKKPSRAYKEIALFTVDGQLRQEPDAVTGFIELARRYGADALLVERPSWGLKVEASGAVKGSSESAGVLTQSKSGEGQASAEARIVRPEERTLFRGLAVVYTAPPENK